MNITEAIEDRRTRSSHLRAELAQIEGEIVQLEKAQDMVAGILGGAPVKPPARAQKKPAPAEKPRATGSAAKTKPGDKMFARCGHSTELANRTSQGRCRICAKESQRRWQEKHARKTPNGRSPKTKSDPDPAPASPPRILASVTAKPEGLLLSGAERARFLEQAESRKRGPRQHGVVIPKAPNRPENHTEAPVAALPIAPSVVRKCTALDFNTGEACTLAFHRLPPNGPLHTTADGRGFRTAVTAAELPPVPMEAAQ